MKNLWLAASLAMLATAASAQKSPSGNNAFDGLDKNRDGYLSREEVAGNKELEKRFAKFDGGKDGRWSLSDFIKANQDNDKRIAADSAITTKVKSKFLLEKGIPSTDISVETYEGRVLLSGFVANQEQVAKAGRLAAGISGVTKVENKLAVK